MIAAVFFRRHITSTSLEPLQNIVLEQITRTSQNTFLERKLNTDISLFFIILLPGMDWRSPDRRAGKRVWRLQRQPAHWWWRHCQQNPTLVSVTSQRHHVLYSLTCPRSFESDDEGELSEPDTRPFLRRRLLPVSSHYCACKWSEERSVYRLLAEC